MRNDYHVTVQILVEEAASQADALLEEALREKSAANMAARKMARVRVERTRDIETVRVK